MKYVLVGITYYSEAVEVDAEEHTMIGLSLS